MIFFCPPEKAEGGAPASETSRLYMLSIIPFCTHYIYFPNKHFFQSNKFPRGVDGPCAITRKVGNNGIELYWTYVII